MNTFDVLLLLTLLFSTLVGFLRGGTKEVFGIFSWIGAGFLSVYSNKEVVPFLENWIRDPLLLSIFSHLFVFCLALIVFSLVAQIVSRGVQQSIAQSIDRSLGSVFGFVRGIFVICVGYAASLYFILPSNQPSLVRESKSYPWLQKSVPLTLSFIPKKYLEENNLKASLEELKGKDLSAYQLAQLLSSSPVGQSEALEPNESDAKSVKTNLKESQPVREESLRKDAEETKAPVSITESESPSAEAEV